MQSQRWDFTLCHRCLNTKQWQDSQCEQLNYFVEVSVSGMSEPLGHSAMTVAISPALCRLRGYPSFKSSHQNLLLLWDPLITLFQSQLLDSTLTVHLLTFWCILHTKRKHSLNLADSNLIGWLCITSKNGCTGFKKNVFFFFFYIMVPGCVSEEECIHGLCLIRALNLFFLKYLFGINQYTYSLLKSKYSIMFPYLRCNVSEC